MGEISVWNRYKQKLEVEKVYGASLVDLAYGSKAMLGLVDAMLARPAFSKAYGWLQNSSLSRHKVEKFIKDFGIPMKDYEPGPFSSFNEFFIRRFKPGVRPFNHHDEFLPAFAEGRYLGFESIESSDRFPIKGIHLTTKGLLDREDVASRFSGGPLLISRLCPVDYHRFHFPDDGTTSDDYQIHGKLHSVNPAALAMKSDIFFTNERHVSILKTKNFGELAYIEVGAICVGKIVLTYAANVPFKRGDEKGYFLFGASSVVVIGEKGKWRPAPDILDKTRLGIETYIHLGDFVGQKP